MQMTRFLKRVLIFDAASCLGMGVLLLAGGSALAALFGLAPALVRGAGLMLVPLGLFILWLGTRQAAHPFLVWLVIVGNVGWTIESLLVVSGTDEISPLGSLFVAGQAATVLLFAALEYVGLQRARAVVA